MVTDACVFVMVWWYIKEKSHIVPGRRVEWIMARAGNANRWQQLPAAAKPSPPMLRKHLPCSRRGAIVLKGPIGKKTET